mmetsp:Transcript_10795/g.29339  ORF Transcript_10795/g.29339 Transcript_10795/m.29339 type:complete len:462 (+) Transcript_10795:19-1404(+)
MRCNAPRSQGKRWGRRRPLRCSGTAPGHGSRILLALGSRRVGARSRRVGAGSWRAGASRPAFAGRRPLRARLPRGRALLGSCGAALARPCGLLLHSLRLAVGQVRLLPHEVPRGRLEPSCAVLQQVHHNVALHASGAPRQELVRAEVLGVLPLKHLENAGLPVAVLEVALAVAAPDFQALRVQCLVRPHPLVGSDGHPVALELRELRQLHGRLHVVLLDLLGVGDCGLQPAHQNVALTGRAVHHPNHHLPVAEGIDGHPQLMGALAEEGLQTVGVPLLLGDARKLRGPAVRAHEVPQLLPLFLEVVEDSDGHGEAVHAVHVIDEAEDGPPLERHPDQKDEEGGAALPGGLTCGVEAGGVHRPGPHTQEVAHDPLHALESLHLLRLTEAAVHEALQRVEACEERLHHHPDEEPFVGPDERRQCPTAPQKNEPDRPHIRLEEADAADQDRLVVGYHDQLNDLR